MATDDTPYNPHPTVTLRKPHDGCAFDRERREVLSALRSIKEDVSEMKTSLAVASERWKRVEVLEAKQVQDRADINATTKETIQIKEQLNPVKALVFGAVGLALISLGGALMALLTKGATS